jgi:hypothetical protein
MRLEILYFEQVRHGSRLTEDASDAKNAEKLLTLLSSINDGAKHDDFQT